MWRYMTGYRQWKPPLINKLQAANHGGEVSVRKRRVLKEAEETYKLKFVMDRFSWTSSSNVCVLPGESGVHQQSGIRIYDGDKKVEILQKF